MKKLFTLLALGFSLSLGAAHAADAPAAKTVQQNKMGTCNADAKTKALKGDERKAFMKDCLSAKPADGASTPAASPMCEKSAADKKLYGAAKNAHVKKCMADSAAPAAAAATPATPATPAAPAKK